VTLNWAIWAVKDAGGMEIDLDYASIANINIDEYMASGSIVEYEVSGQKACTELCRLLCDTVAFDR
jgi:hypothetical protein